MSELKPLEKILGAEFKDQTIELDGKRFEGCVFENCTLLLKGFGPYEMEDCVLIPGCKIETPMMPGISDVLWRQFWKHARVEGEPN